MCVFFLDFLGKVYARAEVKHTIHVEWPSAECLARKGRWAHVNVKLHFFIPSRVSGRGYKIGPVCVRVCVHVRLLVSALTDEPIAVQTHNSAEELTLTISRMSLKVKVIGQRSRSLG